MRRLALVLALTTGYACVASGSCGGGSSPAPADTDPSRVISEEVQRIEQEQGPRERAPIPALEEQCAEVAAAQMEDAEAKVAASEMLTAEDMTALGCSRYQAWLRGEREDY